jgi:hypothetical protein
MNNVLQTADAPLLSSLTLQEIDFDKVDNSVLKAALQKLRAESSVNAAHTNTTHSNHSSHGTQLW